MKKFIVIISFVLLILVLIIWWNTFTPYTMVDIELNQENITRIQKTFADFRLPEGARVEKATKIIQNGSFIYVKVLISVEKIDEFNLPYSYDKHETITDADFNIYNSRQKLKWWNIDRSNADYIIRPEGNTSTEFIYCKPENGSIEVYMQQ